MSGCNQGARHFRRGNKYNAKRTEANGIWFSSKAEARHYLELLLRQRAQEISDLRLQPAFELVVNGRKICPRKFRLDFSYVEHETIRGNEMIASTSKLVVVDVKGRPTREWLVKWELVQALNPGIEFRVVT